MKKFSFSLAIVASLAVLGVMASCGPKPAVPQTVDGIVMDASMNNVMVITTAGDTLSISTVDADPAKVQGVLIDDSVKVTYLPTDMEGVTVLQAQELTVTAHSPYFYIQGSWVEPNPIQADSVQGIKLNQDGTAASIGMATLLFKNWNLADANTLILGGESVGNKQTIPMSDTLTVVKLNADSLVLADKAGAVMWRLGRQK